MSLSKSSLDQIDIANIFILEGAIVEETNIANDAALTATTYIIHEPMRTLPRENASLSEVLSFLNIHS